MKRFLILLVCLVATSVCYSAPTYTSYFNNTHTYTNASVAGVATVGSLVSTNGVTSQDLTASRASFTDSNKKLVSTGTSAALSGALSDETGSGVAVFGTSPTITDGLTLTNTTDAIGAITINQFTGATNAAISVNTAGTSQFKLYGEGANAMSLRNGVNGQTLYIFNTRTDASNFELATMGWSGNEFFIHSNQAGTGVARNLKVGTIGAASLIFQTGNANRWLINSSGHLLTGLDNTYDIGASGATRPRNVHVADNIVTGNNVTAGNTFFVTGSSRLSLQSPSSGVLRIANSGGTDFDRLQFGGTSASFPALKRSTTNLVVRLADDSANTGLEANVLISRLNATSDAAPTIASATTIAPTNSIVFISGTDAIETITAPAPISATGGQITLIPTGIFTTTTAGNIALASTAVVSKALIMTYDSGTTKWYPSY